MHPLLNDLIDITPWRGRVLVLAPFGPPWDRCRMELATLKSLAKRYPPEILALIAMEIDLPGPPPERPPRAFTDTLDFRWQFLGPLTLATLETAEPEVVLPAYPCLLLFNQDGILIGDTAGAGAADMLEPAIRRLLDREP